MKKFKKFFNLMLITLSLLVITTFSGCYRVVFDATDSDVPISLNDDRTGKVIDNFEIEIKAHHLIAGLITLSDPDIQKAIAKEVRRSGGTKAVNVVITHEHNIVDMLLGIITSGIYHPSTVIIEGDIAY